MWTAPLGPTADAPRRHGLARAHVEDRMSAIADALATALCAAGVRRAYTVPGESFLPLLDALDRHPSLQLVSTRHESGAAFMAEADAKLTGVPAVVLATRAVGAANLSIGVHTAHQDSTPMLVLLGQVETSLLGREAFQEVDLPAFYREITKWSVTAPTVDRLPELVRRALHEATSGRPGPAMLAIPADLLEGDAPTDGWLPAEFARMQAPALDPQAASAIAARLSAARAPVLVAGEGVRGQGDDLRAFVEAYGLGVYASFRRQDVFPNDHPQYLGHLSLGTSGRILAAIDAADVVLLLGTRLDEVTTQAYRVPRPDQVLIQIDADPGVVGRLASVTIGAVAEPVRAVRALLERAPKEWSTRRWDTAHAVYLEESRVPEGVLAAGRLHPAAAVAALRRAFGPSTIVTSDAGNFSTFCHRYWRFTEPGTQLAPANGAMGYGVPAAVAAKLAAPGRQVLATVGDGGFLMSGQELETAVRYCLPLTVAVFRNGLYGTIAMHQAREIGRLTGVTISEVDVAGLARAYGARAWSVDDADTLDEAVVAARDCGSVAVLDLQVDPDAITPADSLSGLLRAGHRH